MIRDGIHMLDMFVQGLTEPLSSLGEKIYLQDVKVAAYTGLVRPVTEYGGSV